MIISPIGLNHAGDPYQAAIDAVEVSSALPTEWVDAVRSANPGQPSLDTLSEGIFEALGEERKRKRDSLRLLKSLLQ